jgi:hypothetical protein
MYALSSPAFSGLATNTRMPTRITAYVADSASRSAISSNSLMALDHFVSPKEENGSRLRWSRGDNGHSPAPVPGTSRPPFECPVQDFHDEQILGRSFTRT